HRYNNQDHSMLTAIYAARNIAGERNDVWSVNTEMEYHEDGEAGRRGGVETGRRGDGAKGRRGEGANDNPQSAIPESQSAIGDRLTPTRVMTRAMTPDEIIEVAFAKLDPVALGAA